MPSPVFLSGFVRAEETGCPGYPLPVGGRLAGLLFFSGWGDGPTHNKEACPRSLQSQLHMFPDSPPSLIHLFTHSIVITELAICQALEQG